MPFSKTEAPLHRQQVVRLGSFIPRYARPFAKVWMRLLLLTANSPSY
jgi:hypothetical protein